MTELQDTDPVPQKHIPNLRGTFALFIKPNGSLLIAWREQESTKDRHFELPAYLFQVGGRSAASFISSLKAEES